MNKVDTAKALEPWDEPNVHIMDLNYFYSVLKFARERELLDKFRDSMARLNWGADYAIFIYKDFAPYSFYVALKKEGVRDYIIGVIYYEDAESGISSPQFSVTQSGRDDSRWDLHS